MALRKVDLNDKYTTEKGQAYLTGTQALVRLCLMQRQRDRAAGLNTAGFVTGYRGSPLGLVDREFWRAESLLKPNDIRFQPGVNEDLAATAVWGSQQLNMFPGARHDGVFSMWYGKGPGVDRSGDVFRHGNLAGTAKHGGVLLLAGDDPACKSSTVPSQSEHAFADVQIPFFNPANVQEILDFGLYAWAMSRYSGCWTGMKAITENIDTSASVTIDPARVNIILPAEFEMPDGGLHIRWPDHPLQQEDRLQRHKLYAALAFARANRIDKIVMDSPKPRLGIVTTGKSYLDVRQALEDLGIDDAHAAEIGLRVYKVGMPWPLEREGIREFAEGLDEILVVEEKRAVIENQLKEQLYNWRADVRPRVIGKFDETGNWILPSAGELTPARVARVIANRLEQFYTSSRVRERLDFLEKKEKFLATPKTDIVRIPYFCSGCPHNTSTKVPEGSRAVAGIGCHYMAIWMDRKTATFTHMGGEGANWIGQAPFTDTKHIFVNLGDGTYFHSGLLAIRAAVSAKVTMTYKILFNDAVAMTGGQPMDGPLSVPIITQQVAAEGVGRIAVVTDEPDKYPIGTRFAAGVTVHHRDDLDQVQRDLRQWEGVSVLVYDQTCAAEKRRRRKRGLMPLAKSLVHINQAVCEGCGDCGVQSNCVAIAPVETELGRKRTIDQSACNMDYSCLDGFCPSFVTLRGARPRKRSGDGIPVNVDELAFADLPTPEKISCDEPYGIVITGIGGTGVITIGAILGMAAHLENKGVSVLDMAGLAQKNGAVVSHVRIADNRDNLHAVRIAAGGGHLLLGGDFVTAGGAEALAKLHKDFSNAVVNSHRTMTADFTHDPDMEFPADALSGAINDTCAQSHFVNAGQLAPALLGDAISANLFLVGYAWQKGLIPLGADSIERALEINGIAVDFNKQAFLWGRRAAHDLGAVEKIAGIDTPVKEAENIAADPSGDLLAGRITYLSAYQDSAYAARYHTLVEHAQAVEAARVPGRDKLSRTIARSYFHLLAYKDEYEVARLFTDGTFEADLKNRFEGDYKIEFHLAPPLVSPRDPVTGAYRKRVFGSWIMPVFRVLARLKGLRGTMFDIFGYTKDRRLERQLIKDYEQSVSQLLDGITADNYAIACEIAAIPDHIRGFGHIKAAAVEKAQAQEAELFEVFRNPSARQPAAAQ